ncbi:conserved uncharacterized protein [Desulfococcus multivorans]|nr:conserved uncharacterized protein [Desulfococcus multivorans]
MPAVGLLELCQGGHMRNNRDKSPDTAEKTPSMRPEIDYSPKTLTLREQIVFGIKLFAVVGGIFLVLWLFEKM